MDVVSTLLVLFLFDVIFFLVFSLCEVDRISSRVASSALHLLGTIHGIRAFTVFHEFVERIHHARNMPFKYCERKSILSESESDVNDSESGCI